MTKSYIFKITFAVWLVLWAVFLVRENKKGQYELVLRSYASNGEEKTRLVYGKEFYDFLAFCKARMPENSTYEFHGFEKYSIDEVRARYFLYPHVCKKEGADYRVMRMSSGPYALREGGGDR